MKLLCDEDVGTGVPSAREAVGYAAASLNSVGWLSKPDYWWLAQAGDNGWVVFSCNKKQLKVSTERQVITDHNVGVVYMTSGEESPALMLKVLVNRWEKLELLAATTSKPFARFLSPRGVLTDHYRDFYL